MPSLRELEVKHIPAARIQVRVLLSDGVAL